MNLCGSYITILISCLLNFTIFVLDFLKSLLFRFQILTRSIYKILQCLLGLLTFLGDRLVSDLTTVVCRRFVVGARGWGSPGTWNLLMFRLWGLVAIHAWGVSDDHRECSVREVIVRVGLDVEQARCEYVYNGWWQVNGKFTGKCGKLFKSVL